MYQTQLLDNRNRAHLDQAVELLMQGEIVAFGFRGTNSTSLAAALIDRTYAVARSNAALTAFALLLLISSVVRFSLYERKNEQQ